MHLCLQIFQDASSEYTVEKLLISIKKKWENRQFNLAKLIYAVKTSESDLNPLKLQGVRYNQFSFLLLYGLNFRNGRFFYNL